MSERSTARFGEVAESARRRNGRTRRVVGLAFVLVAALPAAAAREPTTVLVSVNAAGTGGGDEISEKGRPSANGRYVLFESEASDLVAGDVNGVQDVFVRDLRRGTTTLVSVNAAGTGPGNGASYAYWLSANGRYVAFDSVASDLVEGDTNGVEDGFVRDLRRGTTTLVSVNASGSGSANDQTFATSISANGRFVVFHSRASDLVAGDFIGLFNVYVRDLRRGKTTLVSVNAAGTGPGNDPSVAPCIDASGRFVAFFSFAGDLTADDARGVSQIYVRDLRRGRTTLVSRSADGTKGADGDSNAPHLSANGRFVAFTSVAFDVVANDSNGQADIFLRDLKRGTTALVSDNAARTGSGNDQSAAAIVSANGRYVVFRSNADDLVAGDLNGAQDVFVRDMRRGTTTLVSVNAAGTGGGDGASSQPCIADSGRFIAFRSAATDLVAGDTNGQIDVFLRALW